MGVGAHMLHFLLSLFRIITYLYWQIKEERRTMTKFLRKQIINVSVTCSFIVLPSGCLFDCLILLWWWEPSPCEFQGNFTHQYSCCQVILPSSSAAAAPSADRLFQNKRNCNDYSGQWLL